MKRYITIFMSVLLAAAAIRTAIIFYERHQPLQTKNSTPPQSSYKITADDYVVRQKIYAYDLKSAAAELRGKTVWVSIGNQIAYYRYATGTRNLDFKHEAGLLAPLEKLSIRDVVLMNAPRSGESRQVMAVFTRDGAAGEYVVPIGTESGGNYNFVANDIFFFDDPHVMYKHWPAEVWNAIDRHEVKPGMNELQTSFALGAPRSGSSGSYGNGTLEYSVEGKPVHVTFADNRVVEIGQ